MYTSQDTVWLQVGQSAAIFTAAFSSLGISNKLFGHKYFVGVI